MILNNLEHCISSHFYDVKSQQSLPTIQLNQVYPPNVDVFTKIIRILKLSHEQKNDSKSKSFSNKASIKLNHILTNFYVFIFQPRVGLIFFDLQKNFDRKQWNTLIKKSKYKNNLGKVEKNKRKQDILLQVLIKLLLMSHDDHKYHNIMHFIHHFLRSSITSTTSILTQKKYLYYDELFVDS